LTESGRDWHGGYLERLKQLKRIGITEREEDILRDLCKQEINDLGRSKDTYYLVFDKEAEPEKNTTCSFT